MEKDLSIFTDLVNELLERESKEPVVEPIEADELENQVDLILQQEGISDHKLVSALRGLVLNTPRTATNLFFNQLFGGRKNKAVLGDLLAVILNNSMYTYKVAGPQVGVELEVIKNVASLTGYDESSGGTIAPGGSMSNMMAMIMARDAKNAKTRSEGVSDKFVLYTSAESHYSIPKNASFIGIGRDAVRKIATDDKGKMDINSLIEAIDIDVKAGKVPFFVNATAGTTVLGAFDPIEKIREVCDTYGMWLHVDGAYCGSVIFSEKYKHLIQGVEKADSFSVNAHKMLGTPLTCSLILAKDQKYLYQSFSNEASYLYQTDEDEYNLGKTSLQCGRRNDALKFWVLWKSVGTKGLAAIVDQQFHLADAALKYIRNNDAYTLYSYDDSVSVCFNYKNFNARDLCTLLYEKAEIMVGFGSYDGTEFIRFVTINSGNSKDDILHFFEKLEAFADEHEKEIMQLNAATG